MERVQAAASQMCSHHVPGLMPQLQAKGVVQAVKAVCALMGNVETQDITVAVESFKSVCLQFIPAPPPVIILFSILSFVMFTCLYLFVTLI
jgi:phosphatidylinositol-4-phosphate 3-kinase